MDKKVFHELKDMLCREAEDIQRKGELTPTALDNLNKITGSMKNIDKILMAERFSEGGSYNGGSYRGDYPGSYGNGYDNDYSERRYRDSNGRYASRGYDRSWGDAKDTMLQQLSDMMSMTNDSRTKDIVRRAREELERM